MTDPPPLPISCGMAAAIVCQTPVRLVSIVSCQTAGVTSSQACRCRCPHSRRRCPACRAPYALVDDLPDGGGVTDVGLAMIFRPTAVTAVTVSARFCSLPMP